MSTKLGLTPIRIKSFITSLNEEDKKGIRGGTIITTSASPCLTCNELCDTIDPCPPPTEGCPTEASCPETGCCPISDYCTYTACLTIDPNECGETRPVWCEK